MATFTKQQALNLIKEENLDYVINSLSPEELTELAGVLTPFDPGYDKLQEKAVAFFAKEKADADRLKGNYKPASYRRMKALSAFAATSGADAVTQAQTMIDAAVSYYEKTFLNDKKEPNFASMSIVELADFIAAQNDIASIDISVVNGTLVNKEGIKVVSKTIVNINKDDFDAHDIEAVDYVLSKNSGIANYKDGKETLQSKAAAAKKVALKNEKLDNISNEALEHNLRSLDLLGEQLFVRNADGSYATDTTGNFIINNNFKGLEDRIDVLEIEDYDKDGKLVPLAKTDKKYADNIEAIFKSSLMQTSNYLMTDKRFLVADQQGKQALLSSELNNYFWKTKILTALASKDITIKDNLFGRNDEKGSLVYYTNVAKDMGQEALAVIDDIQKSRKISVRTSAILMNCIDTENSSEVIHSQIKKKKNSHALAARYGNKLNRFKGFVKNVYQNRYEIAKKIKEGVKNNGISSLISLCFATGTSISMITAAGGMSVVALPVVGAVSIPAVTTMIAAYGAYSVANAVVSPVIDRIREIRRRKEAEAGIDIKKLSFADKSKLFVSRLAAYTPANYWKRQKEVTDLKYISKIGVSSALAAAGTAFVKEGALIGRTLVTMANPLGNAIGAEVDYRTAKPESKEAKNVNRWFAWGTTVVAGAITYLGVKSLEHSIDTAAVSKTAADAGINIGDLSAEKRTEVVDTLLNVAKEKGIDPKHMSSEQLKDTLAAVAQKDSTALALQEQAAAADAAAAKAAEEAAKQAAAQAQAEAAQKVAEEAAKTPIPTEWNGKAIKWTAGDDLSRWHQNILAGKVESMPEGMGEAEFLYKLSQLQQMAPVVYRKAIDAALLDMNCDDKVLSAEQIKLVHEGLSKIDSSIGDYHGYEPTARTCNVTNTLSADINCSEKKVDIYAKVTYGDCNQPVVEPSPAPAQDLPPLTPAGLPEIPKTQIPEPAHFNMPTAPTEIYIDRAYGDQALQEGDKLTPVLNPDGSQMYTKKGEMLLSYEMINPDGSYQKREILRAAEFYNKDGTNYVELKKVSKAKNVLSAVLQAAVQSKTH